MMPDDNTIIEEARSWVGGRWIHGQSVKGVGADCVQFVTSVAKNLGWIPESFRTIKYSRDWAMHNDKSILIEEFSKVADRVAFDDIKVGDVLIFNTGRCAGHSGLYIGNGMMIHAHIRHGITEEEASKYRDKFDSAWRIKQHGDG